MGTELRNCVVCGAPLRPAFAKDGFELVVCRDCGMLMRRFLPEPSDLPSIYGPEYYEHRPERAVRGYADYLGDAERHREIARRRLALLRRFSRRGGKLLDVGAAAGFFVAEAQAAGWDAEGIDVAEHMVEWGRSRLGVPLHACGISAIGGDGSYAAVTMWDYIEHALDPRGDLSRSYDLLSMGGFLALSTGDLDSLAARVSRSSWHLLTPRHHNYFFSRRTLERLLGETGFDVAWAGHPGARYSLAHIAHKSLPTPIAERLARAGFARASVSVNLFDIVTVIARKT
jgi:SAM-dependent methyltransferase